MSLEDIGDALQSHALASGWFDKVNGHEPKSAPGKGVTCSFWLDTLGPLKRSGLAASSALLVYSCRIQMNMLAPDQDAIDPEMLRASSALMSAYSGDFTLGGQIENIDLLGANGPGLSLRAGYIDQDGKKFRVYVITIPMVVEDLWEQQP